MKLESDLCKTMCHNGSIQHQQPKTVFMLDHKEVFAFPEGHHLFDH